MSGPRPDTVTLNAPSSVAPTGRTPLDRAAVDRAEVTRDLAAHLQDPPAVVLTTSCTHALEAAATVLGVGPGDEVVVPAFTFPSTANAFLLRGATVRFADVREDTATIDPVEVERVLSRRTKVVVPVHYGGIAADPEPIAELARGVGADIVEDAAHGMFATRRGVALGRLGRLGCLSFHRTKNLSTYEGGALVVNDPDLVAAVEVAVDKGTNRVAFERGEVSAYEWTSMGSSWRMPDPSVALLAEQLVRSETIQARRQAAWRHYASELADWAAATGAALPSVPDDCAHPAHLFWIVLPPGVDRDAVVTHCAAAGIEVARHYGSLPDSRFGRTIRHPDDRCPVAAQLAERLVRLPMHHELGPNDLERVVAAMTSAAF